MADSAVSSYRTRKWYMISDLLIGKFLFGRTLPLHWCYRRGEKRERRCSSIMKRLLFTEQNIVFSNSVELHWLNQCAENHEILLVSFNAGFLTSMSKRWEAVVMSFFFLCKWSTSPGRFTMFRGQGTQLVERMWLCSLFIVCFNKAHRLF